MKTKHKHKYHPYKEIEVPTGKYRFGTSPDVEFTIPTDGNIYCEDLSNIERATKTHLISVCEGCGNAVTKRL